MIKKKNIRRSLVFALLLVALGQNKSNANAAGLETSKSIHKTEIEIPETATPIPSDAVDSSTASDTTIQLTQTQVSIETGQNFQLVFQLIPLDAMDIVNFKSDNEGVVVVDTMGILTGVREGSATVTVSLLNGQMVSCTVTVVSNLKSMEFLYISKNICTLAVEQSRTIQYKVIPENASIVKMIWSSSDEAVAVVSENGEVTGKKVGEAQITMEADDGSGIKSILTIKVIKRGKGSKYSEDGLTIVKDSKARYTYSKMVSDLKSLNKKYGDCITLNILNVSYDKRNIYEVILGNPNAQKKIVVQSSMHAREYMATLLTMKQIEFYCKNYYSGIYENKYYSELFDEVAFHIIPMENPDGVTISQYGAEGIRDKGLRTKIIDMCKKYGRGRSSYYTRWKANARGVDINRNFDSYWSKLKSVVNKPGAYFYKGKKAESEIETITLTQIINKVEPVAVINYHATGSILYWYFGQSGTLKTESYELVEKVNSLTKYSIMKSKFSKSHSAGFGDWVSIKKKTPVVTVEVGKKSCPLKIKELDSIWKKNRLMYVAIAKMY